MKKFLVLSGGGARGAAHVGVIRALEERGFVPDAIVGVSIGAVVGAGYAVLKDSKKLWDYSEKIYKKAFKFFPISFSLNKKFNRPFAKISCYYMANKVSILSSKLYFKIFEKAFGKLSFEDLKIKFYAISNDLKSGKIIIHSSGKIIEPLKASMAIPGIFPPVEFEDKVLVDGGTLNNLPTDIARKLGADYVVAVDLSENNGEMKMPETSNDILNVINHMCEDKILSFLRKEADFIIRPPVNNIGTFEFKRSLEIMEKAYEYTKKIDLPKEMLM
ncbi:patatin-like phospholipase family protein [Thermosipho atlanticus]|uniref:NTE family protein n=1 Tax=Thermosipho atlanticus DSM 15807 TaxID=1123380 RepID=A0A1M5SMV8_9BACT|nr:patatin-like phospholipase family protein [Thermosipho atlanticus]SHH39857.1 NTE family protein [Thermosipho atlanticus DSM 15807]